MCRCNVVGDGKVDEEMEMKRIRISKAGLNDFQWPGTRGILAPLYATTRLPHDVNSQPLQQQHEKKGNRPANMSDFEDDMDVDAPAARDSLLFSSDNTNTKGKRSAANLPVEAEDSLPW